MTKNKYSGFKRIVIKKRLSDLKQYVKYFYHYQDMVNVCGGYYEDENKLAESQKEIEKYELMLNEKE